MRKPGDGSVVSKVNSVPLIEINTDPFDHMPDLENLVFIMVEMKAD